MIFNNNQRKIAAKIDSDFSKSNWKNWKWQTKHRIKSLDVLESLLELKLSKEKRLQIQETINKFPMLIKAIALMSFNTNRFSQWNVKPASCPELLLITLKPETSFC